MNPRQNSRCSVATITQGLKRNARIGSGFIAIGALMTVTAYFFIRDYVEEAEACLENDFANLAASSHCALYHHLDTCDGYTPSRCEGLQWIPTQPPALAFNTSCSGEVVATCINSNSSFISNFTQSLDSLRVVSVAAKQRMCNIGTVVVGGLGALSGLSILGAGLYSSCKQASKNNEYEGVALTGMNDISALNTPLHEDEIASVNNSRP
jgi:hypothetical protein